MQHRYLRIAVLGAIGAGLTLSQQACAGEAFNPAAQPATATTSADLSPAARSTSPTMTADHTPNAGATTTAATRAPDCSNDDVKAEVTFQPQAVKGKDRAGLLTLTNRSNAPCRVEGRASVSLTNAADEVVDVPTEEADEPGQANAITLKPGRTAFQGIKWTTCDKAASGCRAGNGLRFNLQASTDGPAAKLVDFPAAEKSAITMGSLRVGTL